MSEYIRVGILSIRPSHSHPSRILLLCLLQTILVPHAACNIHLESKCGKISIYLTSYYQFPQQDIKVTVCCLGIKPKLGEDRIGQSHHVPRFHIQLHYLPHL